MNAASNGTVLDAYFTVEEVAHHLKISEKTVRRWIKSSELIAHRYGGQWRISETDLRTFERLHRRG